MKKYLLNCLSLLIVFSANSQSCPPNIDFESGNFTNWQTYQGTVALVGGQNVVNLVAASPTILHHAIMQNNYFDPNISSLPLVAPGSHYSARLGHYTTVGSEAERISYHFTIPATATAYSLTYQYALVQQNPSHVPLESQPHFSAKIYDSTTHQYISCATNEFYYGSPNSNFLPAPGNSNIMYKPWTAVTVNLDAYAGHYLIVEFTNADCAYGGHWAYSYVDIAGYCGVPVLGNIYCAGSNANLVAPFGFQSYTWWNSNLTQSLGNTQALTLSPPPPTPTVYAVDVIPFPNYGCRDTVFVTVQPGPGAIVNAGPDIMICPGMSVTLGSPAIPGYKYTWFPTSGLNNATIAQPVVQLLATTAYVVLAIDTTTGCSSKDTVIVNVVNTSANFNVNLQTQCLAGNLFQFTSLNLTPGLSYFWDFGDGSVSTLQNPIHTYAALGSYTVKFKTVHALNCNDSITKIMSVITAPAATTITQSGNTLTSAATNGNQWHLNGNAITGATGQNYTATVSGVYTVKIVLNGCESPASNAITLTVTGIDPVTDEWKLKVGPNPVNNKLLINYTATQKLDLEILDFTGRLLYASKSIPSTYFVDMAKFRNGTYLVRLKNNKTKVEVNRLVVKI